MTTDIARRAIDTHFDHRRGELLIGGVPVGEIASEFGTPSFVYDQRTLETCWRRLRDALPERVRIFYSVKANPSRAILRSFLELGAGLEIASGGELAQALSAGCEAENIVFAGPGKSESETREFLEAGGGEIHVESELEAERLVRLSEELGVDVAAAIRVNPSADAQGGAMRMGGKAAPFGVDEERLDAVAEILSRGDRIRTTGIHIFAGTQILDAEVLAVQYRKAVEIAERLARRIGPLTTIDFGGGLGIPYFDGETPIDIERYGASVRDIVDELDPGLFGGARLIVEPGRYLIGEAGVYLVRVTDVKMSRGKRFVVLDGGMNHHLAASGNLGQVIKRNFPIVVANRIGAPDLSPAEVVGPLCTPLDTLARKLSLPDVQAGDLVAVLQSGAYARSASPLGFLSHVSPAEVMVSNGAAALVRRRGTYAQLMQDLV